MTRPRPPRRPPADLPALIRQLQVAQLDARVALLARQTSGADRRSVDALRRHLDRVKGA